MEFNFVEKRDPGEKKTEVLSNEDMAEKLKTLSEKEKLFVGAIANHNELMELIKGNIKDEKLRNNLNHVLSGIFNNLHDLYKIKPEPEDYEVKNSVDLEKIGFQMQKNRAKDYIEEGVWDKDRYGA